MIDHLSDLWYWINNITYRWLFLHKDHHNCPQSVILTSDVVLPAGLVPTFYTALTTSIPFVTYPKTTCLPSSQSQTIVVMKNCDPLVFGPALAIDNCPGLVCLRMKFSSSNFVP